MLKYFEICYLPNCFHLSSYLNMFMLVVILVFFSVRWYLNSCFASADGMVLTFITFIPAPIFMFFFFCHETPLELILPFIFQCCIIAYLDTVCDDFPSLLLIHLSLNITIRVDESVKFIRSKQILWTHDFIEEI